ncbi:MAG: CoA transferase [Rhodospirillaceae bacterium]|jgi:crotonobetainyl-CoA:carnitine CoA-transferase CaiB-like acyl-CoA transferase|nr:CoA transferase [Rhodospirillaceae bacterium]MBT4487520.1 CoA transferase [Rhodospirillaceae bacterium]MBT5195392.1 CoA transferase [Rhodospirillaceae bacterium]MBT5895751.1 CoA transferase [Rhodospirillaceae bacterium]MBT7759450.1 CoA transferase [Rhodospirillaceae bacterium]
MHDALQGVTVLEVGALTPGKYCGYLMTGWGAKSIRIERETQQGDISNEDLQLNRGKRSMVLNLRDEVDRKVLLDLARTADVLIESYRPGVTKRLGIDYDAIRGLNDRIIYCSLSGFGQDGPDANRAAYDLLFQAETGIFHTSQANNTEYMTSQTYLADSTAGLTAAFAITAALQARSHTGMGRHIDLSIQESLFSLLSVSHGTVRDGVPVSGRDSVNRSHRPIYNIYQARDGRSVALTAFSEASGRALFRYFGDEDLCQYGHDFGQRGAEAKAFLQRCFLEHDAQYWVEILGALEIEIALVQTPEEAFENKQLQSRNMILDTKDQAGQKLRQIGFPATSRRAPAIEPAPNAGAHQPSINEGSDHE